MTPSEFTFTIALVTYCNCQCWSSSTMTPRRRIGVSHRRRTNSRCCGVSFFLLIATLGYLKVFYHFQLCRDCIPMSDDAAPSLLELFDLSEEEEEDDDDSSSLDFPIQQESTVESTPSVQGSMIKLVHNSTKKWKYDRNKWRPSPHHYFKTPFPIFVASLPKSGTTSIYNFFFCGGVRSVHTYCPYKNSTKRDQIRIGALIEDNIRKGKPPFEGCGTGIRDVQGPIHLFSDTGTSEQRRPCYFPSVSALDAMYQSYPNMTIVLGYRNSTKWYHSVRSWGRGGLIQRWTRFCSFMPDTNTLENFIEFYEGHNQHVREFAKKHPSITFLEFSIDSPHVAEELEAMTNISATCWGHSKPTGVRRYQLKLMKDTASTLVSFPKSTRNVRIKRPSNKVRRLGYTNYTGMNREPGAVHRKNKWLTSPDGYLKTPFPIFVASLPKSGTTSVHSFFLCGKVRSVHTYCAFKTSKGRKQVRIGELIEENLINGAPPFQGCGMGVRHVKGVHAFSDTGNSPLNLPCFMPSISALDAMYNAYPNMTIVLSTRNSVQWYQSVKAWGGGHLFIRWIDSCPFMPNRTDLRKFIAFYEWHNQHVRDFAKRHPSITLIEFQIDSPTAGSELESMTNISSTCWGHSKPIAKTGVKFPMFKY